MNRVVKSADELTKIENPNLSSVCNRIITYQIQSSDVPWVFSLHQLYDAARTECWLDSIGDS